MSNLQGLEGLMSQIKSASDAYLLAENAEMIAFDKMIYAQEENRKANQVKQAKKEALYKLEQRLLNLIRK